MTDDHPIARAYEAIVRGDVPKATRLLEGATPASPADHIVLHLVQAMTLLQSEHLEPATRLAREALAQARALDDDHLETEAILVYAQARAHQRADADVAALLERALRVAKPQSAGHGRILVRQATNDVAQRRMAQAEGRLLAAVTIFEGLGRRDLLADARIHQANAMLRQGRLDEASQLLDAAQLLLDTVDYPSREGALHTLRAHHAWLGGDLALAERELLRSQHTYASVGMHSHEAECAINRAEVLRSAGRLDDAHELYVSLQERDFGQENRFFVGLNHAVLLLQLGDPLAAAARAEALLEERSARHDWLDGLLQLLALPRRLSDRRAAWATLRLGRTVLLDGAVVFEPDVARVLPGVARHLDTIGELDLAAATHALALDHLSRVDADEADLQAARSVLGSLRDRGARPRLGDVWLEAPIGSGGMGAVWEGRSELLGVAVAVKVVRARASSGACASAQSSTSLMHEVHQVASLRHHAIVDVLDTGVVPPSAEAMSDGELVAGSPWVAMELVRGGTLADLRGRVDWPTAREVLSVLLDALAHAHARDLVHLDIKPANVLVAWDRADQPLRVCLVDFGISRSVHDVAQGDLVGGTPRYMAPEQFRQQGRIIGPWTDLYALACLAFEMLTGRPPFQGSKGSLADAHLHRAPPPLRAACAVPEGLEAWLHRLLSKHPLDRYLRAADASVALAALDHAPMLPPDHPHTAEVSLSPADTWVLDAVAPARASRVDEPSRASVVQHPALVCPLEPPAVPPPRAYAGVALLAHRVPSVIGREAVERELWSTLRATHRERRARWVELRAPTGLRARALCEWLAFRAHEVGVATPVMVREGEEAVAALVACFGVHGLRGTALRRALANRTRRWKLDATQLERLARSVDGPAAAADLELWLRAACTERGVVLVLEEPAPALRQLAARLDGQDVPLLVLSFRDPLGPRPQVASPRSLELEPLDHAALFDGLRDPPMSPELRHELADIAEGCEGVALGMLAYHAGRGDLVDGPSGLERRPTFRSELRLHPSERWTTWVRAWRGEVAPEVWDAIERVCLVIQPVPSARIDPEALRILCERGWVRRGPDGVVPRNSDLRRAVRTQILDEGRLEETAASCLVEDGWAARSTAALSHWAGQIVGAEAAYRALMTETIEAGQFLQAMVDGRRWERLARQLGLGESDPRWAQGQQLRACATEHAIGEPVESRDAPPS